jgi:hydrogenase maturation protease
MKEAKARYLVGVGNWTMSDDSLGLRVVEHIAKEGLDQGFEVVDLSGSGIRLLNYFSPGTNRILVVDTVLADKEPGDFFFFKPNQVLSEKDLSQFTTHESDLLKTIHMGKELDYTIPPIKIMGIQPATVEQGLDLSKVIQDHFEEYVNEAIKALLGDSF